MCETVLLYPRPLARYPGRLLLLPLLPHRSPLKPLPSEIWSRIFMQALFEDDQDAKSHNAHNDVRRSCLSLMLVCKGFKEVAMPLLYSRVCLHSVNSLQKFTAHLHSADQMWDSIRRIPYSTPGRWVQVLDLSELLTELDSSAYYAVNALLAQLFPLLPFLAKLTLYSGFLLSRRALASLTHRDGSSNIRVLAGIHYDPFIIYSAVATGEDPFVQLLRVCVNLEILEVTGVGLDDTDLESHFDNTESIKTPHIAAPLYLPYLRSLTLLSMPSSLLMYALLHSPLPRLWALSLTPYDDIPFPASLSSLFLETHGQHLRTISLFTPKSWPTRYHSSPTTILHTSPHLKHLSLEYPLPALTITFQTPLIGVSSPLILPLQILSIPRPSSDFWVTLEKLLPFLPSLQVIRMRDVWWLRHGMTSRAQEAGIQGEMREWDRRLTQRGIRLLDGNWKESRGA